MADGFRTHDLVALLGDLTATHFETGQRMVLRRGQVGTVVMEYEGSSFEVEFADRDGRTYALIPVPASHLMLLRDTPEYAVA